MKELLATSSVIATAGCKTATLPRRRAELPKSSLPLTGISSVMSVLKATDLQRDGNRRTLNEWTSEDRALFRLAGELRKCDYDFSTVTPLTQERVNARPANEWATRLTDVFGWSRPFREGLLPNEIVELMRDGKVITPFGGGWLSLIRVSTLHQKMFFHSSYPTLDADAVFFGPDSVRFVDAIRRHLKDRPNPPQRVVDIGCGAGPGGIFVAAEAPGADVLMLDINAAALSFAHLNAAINDVTACVSHSDILASTEGLFDLIVSNPPYLIDRKGRAYRHGGGRFGEGLSIRILEQSLPKLSKGGMLILYTGTAIVAGHDAFEAAFDGLLNTKQFRFTYSEIDPDVFGEELEKPAYAAVDRIAAVVLTVINEEYP